MPPRTRTHLDGVVAACRRLRDANRARADAIRTREVELYAMYTEDGVPKSQVHPRVIEALHRAGFTPDEVAELGVSRGNIRNALDRPRAGG